METLMFDVDKEMNWYKMNPKEERVVRKPKEALTYYNGRAVNMLTIEGVYIKTIRSIEEAARQLGIHSRNIKKCLHEGRETAGGYKWEFANKKIND